MNTSIIPGKYGVRKGRGRRKEKGAASGALSFQTPERCGARELPFETNIPLRGCAQRGLKSLSLCQSMPSGLVSDFLGTPDPRRLKGCQSVFRRLSQLAFVRLPHHHLPERSCFGASDLAVPADITQRRLRRSRRRPWFSRSRWRGGRRRPG